MPPESPLKSPVSWHSQSLSVCVWYPKCLPLFLSLIHQLLFPRLLSPPLTLQALFVLFSFLNMCCVLFNQLVWVFRYGYSQLSLSSSLLLLSIEFFSTSFQCYLLIYHERICPPKIKWKVLQNYKGIRVSTCYKCCKFSSADQCLVG